MGKYQGKYRWHVTETYSPAHQLSPQTNVNIGPAEVT